MFAAQLFIFFGALISIASGTCFSKSHRPPTGSGDLIAWPALNEREAAREAAVLVSHYMPSTFRPHASYGRCVQLKTQKPGAKGASVLFAYFEIGLVSDEIRSIGPREAADGLLKEITGCENGGDSQYEHWRYLAYPLYDCPVLIGGLTPSNRDY
ncbi:hypothetical protein F5B20DRAFT_575563 [Whalleya microplaca]|nr:hypothetical protein F5B20DRAFT_575563 [Whalleya microplaca]